ncbi:MAG: twin-arginine translocase TatA/TatE family subunit [Planctomycetota bacterium]|nr:twin-arginine translocase TatA/TatE family subunit [Planctomycetota bacterium]
MLCFLSSMGLSEWLLVVVLVLLLFGAPRIPQLMKGMGQGIKEFKKGLKDEPGTEAGTGTATEVKKDTATPETTDNK